MHFWDETIVLDSSECDFEIEEVVSLFKKWCNINNIGSINMNDKQIIDLIQYFFPTIDIERDKYISGISCDLWDKQQDIQTALDSMKELMDRWADFDRPLFHGGKESSFTIEIAANWKLAVENYCESYHLPWVHPGLNSYSKLEDHYHIEYKNKFSGQGTKVYQQLKDKDGNVFPDFSNLEAKWDTAAEYIAVYPNVLLGVHRDHAFAIILIPDSPEKTYEHIHLFYSQEDTPEHLRLKNSKQWRLVFDEDVPVVEGMQKGRHAVNFDGGRFSPVMDNPTHCFHYWVANEVQNGRMRKS